MSKDSKGFPLVCKEDFIYYLRDIIATTARYLIRLKRYIKELEEFNESKDLNDDISKMALTIEYESFFDKIRYVETVLMNLIGDKTKQALSYNKFREIADKRMSKGLELNLEKLSDEMKKNLNRFNNWRNTNLHIPLSLLSATRELAEHRVAENPELFGHIPNNPIYVDQYEFQYSSLFIMMLDSNKEFYGNLRKMHQQMKRDYSKLIGESVYVVLDRKKVMMIEDHITINQMSNEKNLRKDL
ncbi:hypothetical protein [Paenibacillus pabuli]|uniref:hypothetical protein n=1 Tax=Paenibacillus pabuli TaxID=1472 RepID=UPI001FFE66C1|nr:hypothetical protein [Paenibacillus pabuli]UPK45470.1 hypothetical protein KET34_08405 [Paenibacillus pabuli]